MRKIFIKSRTNGWEWHIKSKELERKHELELELRRKQFQNLKIKLIVAFVKTNACAVSFIGAQKQPKEQDDFRKEFKDNKKELVGFLKEICYYDEITFDKTIKSGIISWEIENFKTQEELKNWLNSFSEYICPLDII